MSDTNPIRHGPNFQDLTGKQFGRLVVIYSTGIDTGGHTRWLCRCECGKTTTVSSSHLKRGHVRSCGCLLLETRGKSSRTHGHKGTPIYDAWRSMIARCKSKTAISYPNYGARGIRVCWRWRKFANFLADMGERPDGMSIERIDNDGNYCKSNCRWASRSQQQRNTRVNRMLTFNGETLCMAAWAERFGLTLNAMYFRLKFGWTMERISSTPLRKPYAASA